MAPNTTLYSFQVWHYQLNHKINIYWCTCE